MPPSWAAAFTFALLAIRRRWDTWPGTVSRLNVRCMPSDLENRASRDYLSFAFQERPRVEVRIALDSPPVPEGVAIGPVDLEAVAVDGAPVDPLDQYAVVG